MKTLAIVCLVAAGLLAPGCSLKRMAVNKVGDALAAGGTTFSADNDPELIEAAAPFSLKLMESLLAESPRHKGLLLALSSGFTQYAYAFVQQDAERKENEDIDVSLQMRARARKLYLRARDYSLRTLEMSYPGFTNALRQDALSAVKQLKKSDVPATYWAAASWAAAIGITKDNTDLIADLPLVEALIDRALALDETYDHGAIHSFLVSYESVRPGSSQKAAERARSHFDRAVELTLGQLAGPFVSYAEAVSIPQQNKAEFQKLLNQALAIDVNARPEWRLANTVVQRRARWLLSQTDQLISSDEK